MKRNFKWVLFGILIIVLVITVFLFLNFLKKRNIGRQENDKFNEIYGINYLRTGVSYSEDGVLVDENFNLIDSRYLTFSEDYVEFCNPSDTDVFCEKFNYSFKDGEIYFDSSDYFVVKGFYRMEFNDTGFTLIQSTANSNIIYYFSSPMG